MKEVVKIDKKTSDIIPFFDLEVSTYCNLKCTFCPRNKILRKKGLMNEKVIRYLTHWLPSNARIMISGMGEPSLFLLMKFVT